MALPIPNSSMLVLARAPRRGPSRLVTVLSNAPARRADVAQRVRARGRGRAGHEEVIPDGDRRRPGDSDVRIQSSPERVIAPRLLLDTRNDDEDDAREADRARLLLRSSLASARSIARGNTPPMNALRCRVAPIRRVAAVRRSDALVAPTDATAVSTRVDAVRGKRDISRARTPNESGAASAPAPGAASRASRSRRALRTTRRGRELCRRENSARRALRRQGTAVTRGGFVNWRKVQ